MVCSALVMKQIARRGGRPPNQHKVCDLFCSAWTRGTERNFDVSQIPVPLQNDTNHAGLEYPQHPSTQQRGINETPLGSATAAEKRQPLMQHSLLVLYRLLRRTVLLSCITWIPSAL
jgi:hypothetical protein